jgi:RNA polymerase sigma factor (sigma-70 family)
MRRDEFERLYEEHAGPLYGFLVYRTGDRGLAEDLLGDTFERALKARARFDRRKASHKTWLYSTALNLLRDHARRRVVEQRATAGTGGRVEPPDPLEGVELRDQLGRALAALSAEEREVIALRFGGDLTVPEIARLTGGRPKSVEGRLYRALGKLRQQLS